MDRNFPTQTRKKIGEIEEIEDVVERGYKAFKNFEVDWYKPPDHHYLDQKPYLLMEVIHKQRFAQRMLEERLLLEKHIPSSIFVRAYENRIDLMRAAFVAPPNSDYQHCLFFFDIYFPVNYPNAPPKVWYQSYGLDLNPNLGTDGRVSLNILGTWYGCLMPKWLGSNDKENWNPKESNILHVLHAIESLISLPHPSPESSEVHNKEAFVSACKKMLRVLREPPFGFENLVEGHFRRRAHPVLQKWIISSATEAGSDSFRQMSSQLIESSNQSINQPMKRHITSLCVNLTSIDAVQIPINGEKSNIKL